MSKCIYCGQAEADSPEHYMPACMGAFRNYECLLDKVCRDCNNHIGRQLEEQFCRCGPEAYIRIIKGIKGRSGQKKPSPFYRGSAGGKRITVETKHPLSDYIVLCEIAEEGEEPTFCPARQIIVADEKGQCHNILITEQIREPEDLIKELEARKLTGRKFIECWTKGPEDKQLFERLCEGFNVKINWFEDGLDVPKERSRFRIIFTVNDRYFRAIAKIGFHYFLKQSPQFTGLEEEFRGIKNFIMHGGDQDKWVKEGKQFVLNFAQGLTTDKYIHIIAIDKSYRHIIARLQFFVGPNYVPPPYEVFIGDNPGRIYYREHVGHQFVYFAERDKEGYWGIMEPGKFVRKKLVPYRF